MSRFRPFLPVLALAGCLIVGAVPLAAEPAPDPAPRPAAEFSVDAYAGQVVVVDFWASWCGPCRQALPWLNAMQAEYAEQGLQVVMINLDRDAAAAGPMEAQIGPGIAQFRDPEGVLAGEYDLQGMPSTYVYDRKGELVATHVGFLKGGKDERETELADLLAEGEQP